MTDAGGAPVGENAQWREILDEAGAGGVSHSGGRSLVAHLAGTERILRAWDQPEAVCVGGALHSVYGTEAFKTRLIDPRRREEIARRVGAPAERLATLFSQVRRRDLFAATRGGVGGQLLALGGETVTPEEAAALLVIHMANLIDQAPLDAAQPWLSDILDWGRRLRPQDSPPRFLEYCRELSPAREIELRRLYGAAHSAFALGRTADAAADFERARALSPGLPEPWLWGAAARLKLGEFAAAAEYAGQAAKLARLWGGVWDKRLGASEREALAAAIDRLARERRGGDLPPPQAEGLAAYARGAIEAARPADAEPSRGLPPRMSAYLAALLDNAGRRAPRYPGLSAKPWHEPGAFPIVAALEAAYPAIRAEVAALTEFQAESEPIERVGAWEVAFLYESGRRNAEVCDVCPTLAAIVERFATMRSYGGLIYVSRLAPGAIVKPHRANSPLRLRCHLAIDAPASGAGICVDGQARSWQNGKCLIFDDCFSHHAWNRSDRARVVVIIDLWHPELTPEEVRSLERLHRYVERQGDWMARYRAANAKARLQADDARES